MHKPIDWRDLPYPKRTRKIQQIYSHDEAIRILQSTKIPKQKALLALLIDQGLRISEPCSIFLSDCNMDERKIILRSTKGGNERIIYPSQYVWDLLSDYIETWHNIPKVYLFEGQQEGMPYTSSSIRQFVERSCSVAGVQYKKVHAFRRYLITWSIENKIDITAVADKVGHKGIGTIQKHYLIHSPSYLKNIQSPLSSND